MVIVYCGIPGAGKSTHRKRHHPDLPVVNFDVMRRNRALAPSAVVPELYRAGIEHLSAGQDFIADGAHVRPHLRRHWLTLARQFGTTAHLIVVLAPLDVCIARQRQRTAPCPRKVVVSYHHRLLQQLPVMAAEPWDSRETVRNGTQRPR